MPGFEMPPPPDPDELRAEIQGASRVPWSRLSHLAATRGTWDDPMPLLWVDALRFRTSLPSRVDVGPPGREESRARDVEACAVRCLCSLACLPVLPLETRWLRQTPREDASVVYTGSLVDVLGSASLEEAALRLSRLLRTVGSYEYARELIRDAAAWDREDFHGVGLRLAHAAVSSASWDDEDSGERERARAVLLRWLGFIRGRAPVLPPRPPRGPATRFEVEALLLSWAESGRLGQARRPGVLSGLVTLARVQSDTRVLGRSFFEAWADRWQRLAAEGDAAEGNAAEGNAAEGNAAEGNAAEGDAAEGNAAQRNVAEGDAAEGNAAQRNVAEGDAAEGDAAEGSAAEGNAAESNVAEGNAAAGDAEGSRPSGFTADVRTADLAWVASAVSPELADELEEGEGSRE